MTLVTAPTQDWENPDLPLLIVDEIRSPVDGGGDEYVSFVAVLVTTQMAIEFQKHITDIRTKLPPQAAQRKFKGSVLFGTRKRSVHEPVRQHLYDCIANACEVATLTTTSKRMQSLRQRFPTEGRSDAPTQLSAREFAALRHLIDACIGKWQLQLAPRLDVLVDRSSGLGMDPSQRNLQDGEVEMFQYQPTIDDMRVNSPNFPGFSSDYIVRILGVPDDGHFGDLLLVPDALAYVARASELLKDARDRVTTSDPMYFNWVDIVDWALQRRNGRSKPTCRFGRAGQQTGEV